MAAWVVGALGTFLAGWIGSQKLGFPLPQILLWVGASNLIALIAGLLTLRLEKISWIKKSILAGTLKTWAFVFAFYFGFLLLFFPPLREGRLLSWMALPLMMSTGLMMSSVFGPIQDHFVRNAQRRERERAHRISVAARASQSLDLQRR